MSEVHRYQVVTMLSASGVTIGYDPHGPDVVMASAFDQASRLFLDAAERCVAAERREKELQQRLTAADEREDALGSLVPEAELALKALNVAVSVFDVELADSARRGLRLIIASLKSAEGGGDDSAHDRAYRNGLMQGYNLAINGSEKEYQEAVSRYSGGKDAE